MLLAGIHHSQVRLPRLLVLHLLRLLLVQRLVLWGGEKVSRETSVQLLAPVVVPDVLKSKYWCESEEVAAGLRRFEIAHEGAAAEL
ncbi:hypothetical protein E2C01_011788 [Portunus trituberculatus]|uniref:Secreted protein n=1 Tax=Portunus trituberculatus TaxID=210409 RepID=A0A5B7DC38_PORTR|nr:hypothetical protein [Portunus trituberculatus]